MCTCWRTAILHRGPTLQWWNYNAWRCGHRSSSATHSKMCEWVAHTAAKCWMGCGDYCSCLGQMPSLNPTCVAVVRGLANNGTMLRCQATGPCKTSAIRRITQTLTCRSMALRRVCLSITRPAFIAEQFLFLPRGSNSKWCFIWGQPTVCTCCMSTVSSLATAPTTVWPANTT